jgi:hypothetical protein
VRAATGLPPSPDSLPQQILAWTAGCVLVYSALFAVGNALYGRTTLAVAFGVAGAASGALLYRLMRAMFREEEPPPASAGDALTNARPPARVPARPE